MAASIKRERGVVPRLEQRRGGGGGGSSRSTQSQNGNAADRTQGGDYKLPDWVFYSNADIMHYFRCDEVDVRILKAHLRDFMERNDYDGKPFPTTWEEDLDNRHFRALWNRMAAHSEEFDEMLSGARWEGDDEKPRDLASKLLNCKKRLGLGWKSAAGRRRKAAERKRLADEKEERQEARREKKRLERRAARARESAGSEQSGRGGPTPSEHEERVYLAYSRASPEPTFLEEGICPDFDRSTATPSTGLFMTNASHASSSNSRSPIDDVDSDIEEVDTPVKPKPPVINLDDPSDINNPILAFKKEVVEAMDSDKLNLTFVEMDDGTIDLTGD